MFRTRLLTAFAGCVLGMLPFAIRIFAEEPKTRKIEMPNVRSLAISPDGKILAAGGWVSTLGNGGGRLDHGIVKLWDLKTGSEVATLRHSGYRETESGSSFQSNTVCGLKFSHDGKSLLAGDHLGFVVWDLSTKEQLWRSDVGLTRCLEISPDGKTLAVPADGPTSEVPTGTKLIDLATGATQALFPRGRSGEIKSVAFSPDGKLLATAGSDCKVTVWNVENESFVDLDRIGWPLFAVRFSPDGKTLVAGGGGGLLLYDVKRKGETAAIERRETPPPKSKTTRDLIYSPDGERLFDIGENLLTGAEIRVWDPETWRTVRLIEGAEMALSRDGKLIAINNRVLKTITVGKTSVILKSDVAVSTE